MVGTDCAESALTRDMVVYFWRFAANIFFREIRPRGAWNIPKEGPVIFVAAPHHNQVSYPYESIGEEALTGDDVSPSSLTQSSSVQRPLGRLGDDRPS